MSQRIPVTRTLVDGTVTDGTAEVEGRRVHDSRDLDGNPLDLPPGASFEVALDPPTEEP